MCLTIANISEQFTDDELFIIRRTLSHYLDMSYEMLALLSDTPTNAFKRQIIIDDIHQYTKHLNWLTFNPKSLTDWHIDTLIFEYGYLVNLPK